MLDELVATALRKGCSNLADLARYLPGVFPTDIIAALERTGRTRDIIHSPVSKATSVAVSIPASFLPHPLDYDWRFTPDSRLAIATHIAERSETAVLLGAPSVLPTALAVGAMHLYLLDRQVFPTQPATTAQVLRFDANTDIAPRLEADFVIADPPWYPEHLDAFLSAASQVLRDGGECWLSLPGIGTRPGITQERTTLRTAAHNYGLEILETTEGFFTYETPFFEFNALQTSGISSSLQRWRRGDRWLLRKIRTTPVRPAAGRSDGRWLEIRTGATRWRILPLPPESSGELLAPLVPSHIVPSVSRRFPGRRDANVWTSGNRAYRSTNTTPFIALLQTLALNEAPENADTNHEFEATLRLCRNIIEREDQEQREYETWMAE